MLLCLSSDFLRTDQEDLRQDMEQPDRELTDSTVVTQLLL